MFGYHEYSTNSSLPESKYSKFSAATLRPGEVYLTRDYALELCRENGIILLDEGQYVFHLNNGTTATIYASPFTPKRRKSPYNGYRYKIRKGVGSGHDL